MFCRELPCCRLEKYILQWRTVRLSALISGFQRRNTESTRSFGVRVPWTLLSAGQRAAVASRQKMIKRILIADDSEVFRRAVRTYLA